MVSNVNSEYTFDTPVLSLICFISPNYVQDDSNTGPIESLHFFSFFLLLFFYIHLFRGFSWTSHTFPPSQHWLYFLALFISQNLWVWRPTRAPHEWTLYIRSLLQTWNFSLKISQHQDLKAWEQVFFSCLSAFVSILKLSSPSRSFNVNHLVFHNLNYISCTARISSCLPFSDFTLLVSVVLCIGNQSASAVDASCISYPSELQVIINIASNGIQYPTDRLSHTHSKAAHGHGKESTQCFWEKLSTISRTLQH